MKKYSIILFAALSLGAFSSCDDILDVEPTTAIEAEGAVKDYTTLNREALGAYSALQSGNYYGFRYLLYQDVYADNMLHAGTFTTDREASARRFNASNLQLSSTWASIYTAINRANITIRDADRLTNISEEQRAGIKAEMLFIRALAHFDLVKVFGGVPIVTTPTTTIAEIQNAPRSTEAQVYDAIITDLQNAKAAFETAGNTASALGKRRSSGLAASALLARVALQRGNNALAEQNANEVITSGAYTLESNFANIFTSESGREIIFELDFTLNDQNALGTASDPASAGQKFYLREAAFNVFKASGDSGDKRFAATTRQQGTRYRLLKYEDVTNNADNVPIIRLAEMYLIRAEARVRQTASGGNNILPADLQVISDINMIRSRAGLSPVTVLTNAQALTEILAQRRLEFIGEGFRFMDLKRYNQTCERLGFCPEDLTDFRNLWPIPLQQIEVNPNLTQNPGY
ncbi:RagB/SusD family nutrient uptake outer membrane protein [Pontibacter vulgaris]|uniref:RagB/SusD family nutrient uptake outer membrane protein n=1 Tax=Pontibacter vulgaris TaxID=2905679 RepID=UPI001FA78DD2|nr:RagB/SusD family nutrient uptake outer membrane protein [Pontibacter vulgaris]